MKKFILGFVCGAIILGAVGVVAELLVSENQFPIFVNGERQEMESFLINGRTFLPLRAMGDALGVEVYWNEELSQIEVGMTRGGNNLSNEQNIVNNEQNNEPNNIPNDDIYSPGIREREVRQSNLAGVSIRWYDGEWWYQTASIQSINRNYRLQHSSGTLVDMSSQREVVLENVPIRNIPISGPVISATNLHKYIIPIILPD